MGDAAIFRRTVWSVLRKASLISAVIMAATAVAAPVQAAKQAAIVVDAESGAVLYESNSKAQTFPASLTKMMTLYLLFEAIDDKRFKLDSQLKASANAQAQPATKLGLKSGQQISVEKAIQALVVHSANDVAVVVAEALCGTEMRFARLMTSKARDLGMANTAFRNASGLPNPAQVTTARDMAILARAVMSRFPHHYHFFSTQSFTYLGRTYQSHNRVMKSYAGADGLKTGYIRASGFNVATSAERDGRRLIGVVMGGKSAKLRDKQMARLLDQGFGLAGKSSTQAASLPPAAFASTKKAANGLIPPQKPVAAVAAATPASIGSLIETTVLADAMAEPQMAATAVAFVEPAADAAPAGGGEAVVTWGIQVGAFASYEPAEKAAAGASKRVAGLVKDAQIAVDETAGANGKLYRARLVGLSKSNATAACRQLKAKKVPCLVFQTEMTLAMNGGGAALPAQ